MSAITQVVRSTAPLLLLGAALHAQATTWTSFQDRRGHAMASTPLGGVVMFGGERVTGPSDLLSDTHRLSSGNDGWTRTADGIEGRVGHAMAGVVITPPGGGGQQARYVVFGGFRAGGQPTATTWKDDGRTWDPVTGGGQVPVARGSHAMVGGRLAGVPQIWMYGGFDGVGELGDLWLFEPALDQWVSLGTATGQPPGSWPAARSAHMLAFVPGLNPGDERVYLFGGRTGAAAYNNDLWRYNPSTSTWQLLTPSNPPPARREGAMAYVPGQGGIVLFGGFSASSSAMDDTWIYDANSNSWTQRVTPVKPQGRSGHAATVDVTGNKLILMGGVDSAGQPARGTWMWDSAAPGAPPGAWIEQLPVPTARSGAAFAFDSAPTRQKHVLFGGRSESSGNVLDETWELDGIDWAKRNPTARPAARSDAGMVYHSARNVMVLYGGRNQVSLGDTWEWNGSTWSIPTLSGVPPAADGIQLVYDTTRARLVMPVNGAAAMETWVLAGSAWSQLSLLVNPPLRTNYGAAYDTRTDRIVMFGGMSSNDRATAAYNNETWIFDGTSWVRRFPETSPSPRGWCKLSYDESRSRVVMFGGADATNVFEETWEWDGTNWIRESPVSSPTNPSLAYGHASAYDPERALTVVHGALGTWDYGPVAPADVSSYGVGCPTSSGATLNLKQLGWSRLWLGERLELDIEGAPAVSLGLMLWGLSSLDLNLQILGFSTGPCSLLTSADLASEAVFPPTTRYTSFPMPVDPFLLGLEVYLQMAYFDAPSNPSNPPAVTSNALKMKLGQKASIVTAPFEPNPALNMQRIGAGSFFMGSVAVGGSSIPVHPTTISQPFWIGKYEVTQSQYLAITGINPSFHQGAAFPNASARPVDSVRWHEAVAFCAALNEQEEAAGRLPSGYQYRLPTEAEWEYCCRAQTSSEWNTGGTLPALQANFNGSLGASSVVGSFLPNAWGLHDMHGNVWEWCLDSWNGSANYPSGTVIDPYVTGLGSARCVRGGGWLSPAGNCRSAFRDVGGVGNTSTSTGFRVVLGPSRVFYPRASLGMVGVDAGTFSRGSATIGGPSVPVHVVQITQPLWVARTEVTQADYQSLMGSNPSLHQGPGFPNAAQRPVERVTWADAMAYCAALNLQESAAGRVPAGYQYRLPTEAEWEYFTRAGTTTEWNTGGSLSIFQANFSAQIGQTSVVASYPMNPWTLRDTHGNVWEWCLDVWDGSANYPSGTVSDPLGSVGFVQVHRGGGFGNTANDCRSALRNGSSAFAASPDLGLRIVLAPIVLP